MDWVGRIYVQHTLTYCDPALTLGALRALMAYAGGQNMSVPELFVSLDTNRCARYAAVCCSVLQCVAVCCSVLQCFAVFCSVLQCVAVCCSVLQCVAVFCSVLQCVAVCCSVLQYVAVCCSVRGAGCCRMLPCVLQSVQSVAMCCSVLQCIAVYCSVL